MLFIVVVVQSKIARIIALYLIHPPTTVTLSILFQAQLTEQINMSFVLVVCCFIILHLCGNLPPTPRTDEPRHATTTIPTQNKKLRRQHLLSPHLEKLRFNYFFIKLSNDRLLKRLAVTWVTFTDV